MLYALTPWEPSFTVVTVTVAMITFYLRGIAIARPSKSQQMLFWSGVASLYVATHTQLDYYAEHEFFMHRLQHTILHHIGPILVVLSHPGKAIWAGVPIACHRICLKIRTWRPADLCIRCIMNPFVVTLTFIGLIGLWLIPTVHFVAMLDWRLYRVMNWGMIVNGLMFWSVALGAFGHVNIGQRAAMLLAVMPPQIIIGAVIFYASTSLYPIYKICGRAFGGIDAIADQQIGGVILWIMGSMMSIVGIIINMRELLRKRRAAPVLVL